MQTVHAQACTQVRKVAHDYEMVGMTQYGGETGGSALQLTTAKCILAFTLHLQQCMYRPACQRACELSVCGCRPALESGPVSTTMRVVG